MKNILWLVVTAIIIITTVNVNAQRIGELAPDKEAEIFPNNAFGVDILFSEGGFGLGTFYRRQLSQTLSLFTDFSISEAKDEREFEIYDFWGTPVTLGKKNRVFILPLITGVHYRLFKDVLSDNLRPYINAGVGPTMSVITPYEMEFFDAFGKATTKYAFGGYIGLGANFGLDKKSLLGVNIRYYIIRFFDEGVESMYNRYQKNLGGFFLTINLGMMY
jgi:hypothetical protein